MNRSKRTSLIPENQFPDITPQARKTLEELAKKHYPATWRVCLNAMMTGFQMGITIGVAALEDAIKENEC